VFAIVLGWQTLSWGSDTLIDHVVVGDLSSDLAAHRCALKLYGFISLGLQIVLTSLEAVIIAVTYRLLREDKDGPVTNKLVQVFE
jgi:hypothetical protein